MGRNRFTGGESPIFDVCGIFLLAGGGKESIKKER